MEGVETVPPSKPNGTKDKAFQLGPREWGMGREPHGKNMTFELHPDTEHQVSHFLPTCGNWVSSL